MNWTLIFLLSVFGLVMGLLSLRGLTVGIEPWLWLALAAFTVLVVSKNVPEKYFWHAFFIGLLWGVLNGVTQSVGFNAYLANNPIAAEQMQKAPLNPRVLVLLTGPVIGAVTGSVMGLLVFGAKKLFS